MEDWIDIVKERLQDAQAPLPPNDWEEFEATSLPAKRTRVLPWLIPAMAMAAGLAAVLFLRQPTVPEDGFQVVRQTSVPVAVAADTADVDEPEMPSPLVSQAFTPKIRLADIKPQEIPQAEETDPVEELVPVSPDEEPVATERKESSSSPFVAASKTAKPVIMKLGAAVGAAAGGGLLAALVLPSSGARETPYPGSHSSFDGLSPNSGELAYQEGLPLTNQVIGSARHRFPLKFGLSARMPVADRLYVSTGLDYSLYQSTFTYTHTGEQKQYAHYLGIPVRLDWVFASGRLLEAYVGGGLEGELCPAASLGGKAISKDGIILSLQGAGGVQMNVTEWLGIYVEPQVMWRIPTGDNTLETYRSIDPLMFSVATGLRFTIGK